MEKDYWLGRKSASQKMARNAVSSQARLAHYELAGRYSLQAVSAESRAVGLADSLPPALNRARSESEDGEDD